MKEQCSIMSVTRSAEAPKLLKDLQVMFFPFTMSFASLSGTTARPTI